MKSKELLIGTKIKYTGEFLFIENYFGKASIKTGDIGYVLSIDMEGGFAIVDFDSKFFNQSNLQCLHSMEADKHCVKVPITQLQILSDCVPGEPIKKIDFSQYEGKKTTFYVEWERYNNKAIFYDALSAFKINYTGKTYVSNNTSMEVFRKGFTEWFWGENPENYIENINFLKDNNRGDWGCYEAVVTNGKLRITRLISIEESKNFLNSNKEILEERYRDIYFSLKRELSYCS